MKIPLLLSMILKLNKTGTRCLFGREKNVFKGTSTDGDILEEVL